LHKGGDRRWRTAAISAIPVYDILFTLDNVLFYIFQWVALFAHFLCKAMNPELYLSG